MQGAREIYFPEFKQEAVRLVKTTGKSCAEVARDLGLPPCQQNSGDTAWSQHASTEA